MTLIAPIAITGLPLPLTLQTMVIGVVSLWAGWQGFGAILTYLALGLAGLPVWSGYRADADILMSSSSGFVIGFLVMSLSLVFLASRSKTPKTGKAFIFLLIAHLILLGFAWLYNSLLQHSYPGFDYVLKYLIPSALVKSIVAAMVLTGFHKASSVKT